MIVNHNQAHIKQHKRKDRWQVFKEHDEVLFECSSLVACLRYVRACHLMSSYKAGVVRIGKLIWEAPTEQP